LGLSSPVEKSEEFAALRTREDFKSVVKLLAANLYPKGEGAMAFSLREVTGLIEASPGGKKPGSFILAT